MLFLKRCFKKTQKRRFQKVCTVGALLERSHIPAVGNPTAPLLLAGFPVPRLSASRPFVTRRVLIALRLRALIGSIPELLGLQDGKILYEVSDTPAVVPAHVAAVVLGRLHGNPTPCDRLGYEGR